MTSMEKFNTILGTHSAIAKYTDYILKQNNWKHQKFSDEPLTAQDICRLIFSLIQLNILLVKDRVITNENGIMVDENIIEEIVSKVAINRGDGTYEIGRLIATKENIFTTIRNKLSHSDYYYNENSTELILQIEDIELKKLIQEYLELEMSKKGINVKDKDNQNKIKEIVEQKLKEIDKDKFKINIGIDDFFKYYQELQNHLNPKYNERQYTRNLIISNIKDLPEKYLETDEEIEEFIKKFNNKKYTVKDKGNGIIPKSTKDYLDKVINNYDKGRYDDNEEIEFFKSLNYILTIEKKEINDKEIIKKIKQEILLINQETKEQVGKSDIYDKYIRAINKIINDRYDIHALLNGININMDILLNIVNTYPEIKNRLFNNEILDSYANKKIKYNFEEIFSTITLIDFINLYGYQVEYIFKPNNKYHSIKDREGYLDYSKLDLDGFNPETIDEKEKIINKIDSNNKKIEATINNLNEIFNEYNSQNSQYQNMSKREDLMITKKDTIETKEIVLLVMMDKINEKITKINNLKIENELIKQDFINNPNYFRNLEIIEGIRNSLFHGDVKILNCGQVNNIYDLKLKFTNIHEGKLIFQMVIDMGTLSKLFEKENVYALNEFISNESKVLKKKRNEEI